MLRPLLRLHALALVLALSGCAWRASAPPPPPAEPVIPSQRLLLRGTAVLSHEDRMNYPTAVTDARRALHVATGTPFEPYHICDVQAGRQPVYCATGRPVQGYWLNDQQYVVQLHAHRQALARMRPVRSAPR